MKLVIFTIAHHAPLVHMISALNYSIAGIHVRAYIFRDPSWQLGSLPWRLLECNCRCYKSAACDCSKPNNSNMHYVTFQAHDSCLWMTTWQLKYRRTVSVLIYELKRSNNICCKQVLGTLIILSRIELLLCILRAHLPKCLGQKEHVGLMSYTFC